ncbi:hypothetical protein [Gluconobacter cerinus]|uniref:hypothetical protein n=1 Tax=Gluconobacter cerinus TaxID=38307 RepID=UPI001B8C7994|nr:hypothetical protein [Gluconobacter cerinus]MBS1038121.1 hypothetical protein [Gluconobacter cerinus]
MITRDEIINEMYKTYEEKGGGMSTNQADLKNVENSISGIMAKKGATDIKMANCFSVKLGIATDLMFLKINGEDILIHQNHTMTDKGIKVSNDYTEIKLSDYNIPLKEFTDFFKDSMKEFMKQSDSLKYMPVSSMKN